MYADVAELADAPDLGSGAPGVQVQVLSSAPAQLTEHRELLPLYLGKTTAANTGSSPVIRTTYGITFVYQTKVIPFVLTQGDDSLLLHKNALKYGV